MRRGANGDPGEADMSLKSWLKYLLVVSAAGILAGCGADDVQLNGKVFDMMGMNTASVKKTPKMAPRSGLVVPPDTAQLPAPGSGQDGQSQIAEIQDYDAVRTTTQQDLERQQAEYCKKHYEDAKIHGDQDAVLATGPLGPCQRSVLSAVKNFGSDDESGE